MFELIMKVNKIFQNIQTVQNVCTEYNIKHYNALSKIGCQHVNIMLAMRTFIKAI